MDTARIRSWTPRLLFLSVVAILLLVGLIQYQWFSRSAAVEIEGTLRGLEGSLRQSVFREFQRYAPMAADLEALRSQSEIEEGDMKPFLDRLWATYGPEGTSPGLVSLIAFSDGKKTIVRSAVGSAWEPGVLPEGLPPATTVSIRFGPREASQNLVVAMDTENFFSTYVFPSLLEQFPGAELAWEEGAPPLPPDGENFDSRSYLFNPFTALFNGASVPRTLRVSIPRLFDQPFRNLKARPTAEGPTVRVLSSWTLRATLPPDAPVLGIERRLAWNWLGSALLLVVLGVAFGLVLRQSGRIADLRRREREFVASVSHELRTPLTVIRSAADNFAQGIVAPERQARYGQLILDQSLRLGRMIEEMLSFAQAEAGTGISKVQAPLVFEPWLAELRPPLDALAHERGIQLTWDIGVPASGLSDPEALRLILENLVINAVNHAYPAAGPDQGPRSVRITLRYLVPDRLELTVDDDGRGIAPKEAKKVFEPFYRDQVSRDNQEKGSGLGLFLARHQARRLGGDLRLETPWRRLDGTKRPGCRFTAVIPFRAEAHHGG